MPRSLLARLTARSYSLADAAAGGGDTSPAATPPAQGGDAPPAAPPPVTPPAGTPPAAAAPYLPDGIGDAFKGKTDKETIDALWKHVGALPKPPEKPDGYTLTVPKELAHVLDPADDKVLPLAQKRAHELGLSQPQFEKFVIGLHQDMTAAGLIAPPFDYQAELAKLSDGKGDPAAQLAAGQAEFKKMSDAVTALATRGHLAADEASALISQLDTAASARAVAKLLKLLPSEKGIDAAGSPGGASAKTPAELMFPTHFNNS